MKFKIIIKNSKNEVVDQWEEIAENLEDMKQNNILELQIYHSRGCSYEIMEV